MDKNKPSDRNDHSDETEFSDDEFATQAGGDDSPENDPEFATQAARDDGPDESVEPTETVDGYVVEEFDEAATMDRDLTDRDLTGDRDLPGGSSDAGAKDTGAGGSDEGADDFGGATMVGSEADFDTADPDATATRMFESDSGGQGAAVPDDDQLMATMVGASVADANTDDIEATAQFSNAPDFNDASDELMQTQRADPILLDKLAAGDHLESDDDLEATAKTLAPSKTPTEASVSGGMASGWAGKSQWDLRIHKCDVLGTLTGIPNEIPTRAEDAIGLQTALVDDKLVSDYEIVNELGAGNMGVVYRARQTSLNREVAIKTLKPKKGSGSQSSGGSQQQDYEQEMFVSEAVVTSNLVHPNIVPIHDLARTADGKLFYAMKEVTGTPWNKTIRKPGSLEDKLDILMKVCDAVAYAHSKGVINRDLKPENVVVGDYGEVMVLDWGLAVTTDRFSKKGSVLEDIRGGAGTPVYMPPEQFDRDVRRIGYHSDIYLLGAMLFEILEGFPPHYLRRLWNADKGTNKFNAIVMAVINNEIEEDVTECELMNIARKAMSTNPTERHATVEDFQTAIREYRITGRAEELLEEIGREKPQDYSKHQAAVALFDEAHAKWPDNSRAEAGGRAARLAYGSLAVSKTDLDLARQVVDGQEGEEFDALRGRITASKRRQLLQKVALAVFFFATIGFGAFSYITKQDLIAKDARLKNVDVEIAQIDAKRDQALKEAAEAEAKATAAQERADVALAEADKAKMDADVAEAAAMKATEEAKIAQLEADKALMEADKATKEAETAKAETLVAAAAAKKSQMEAAKALEESMVAQEAADKAKKELVTAEQAVAKATATAKTAEKNAMLAKADAERVKKDAEVVVKKLSEEGKKLQTQIATAKVEQEQLQAEVYKSEYRVHKRYIDAYTELGEYGSAVRQIDEALADTDNIEIQKRAANLRRWQSELRRREGSQELTLGEPIEGGAISRDGRSVALYAVNEEGNVSLKVAVDGSEQVVPAAASDLTTFAFSPRGDLLAAVGGESQQLWRRGDAGWSAVELKWPASLATVDWLEPEFTADGEHLLLVGADEQGTIDVFGCDADVEHVSRLVLAGETDADYSLRDLAIDPSNDFVIASTRRQSLRSYALDWSEGAPKLTRTGPNAPAIRLPIRPEIVRLSPDGEYLAVAEGRELLVLSKEELATGQTFPFSKPSGATSSEIECRISISDLAFSSDSQRLVAGLTEKYLQIWDRNGDQFASSDVEGLYKGQFLAGHSGGVESVGFVGDGHDGVISVGTDNAVREWSVSQYGEYVAHFETLPELLEQDAANDQVSHDAIRADELIPVSFEDDEAGEGSAGTTAAASQSATIEVQSSEIEASKKKEVRFRQGRTSYSARFSRDGERMIVGADDRAAHAFDGRTGEAMMAEPSGGSTSLTGGRVSLFFDPFRNAFLEGHIPQLSSVQFLPPAGELLLTEDYFGSISVWDASLDETGAGFEVSRLLSEYSLSEFGVSADGSLVIAGGAVIDRDEDEETSELRHFGLVWRIEDIRSSPTPRPFLKLEGEHPRGAITAVAISPSGERAITAGRRGRIVVWNLSDGSVIASAKSSHRSDQVSGVAFVDETTFVTTGYDGKVFSWSQINDRLVAAELTQPNDEGSRADFVIRLRQSPDRDRFLTSAVHSRRDADTGETVNTLVLRAWSGEEVTTLAREVLPASDPSKAFRHDLAWSSTGDRVMFVLDGRVSIFDASDWSLKTAFDDGGLGSTRAAFAPSAQGEPDKIASFDGQVTHLWNIDSGDHIAEFRSHASVFAADFSSDREFVATASDTIRIFHADETSPLHGQTVMRLYGQIPSPVADLAFTPTAGSYRLASVDELGTVAVWDWQPGEDVPSTATVRLPFVAAADDPVNITAAHAVRWSPDGKFLATVQFGQTRLWKIGDDSADEVTLPSYQGTHLRTNAIAWAHDSSRLVAVGSGRDRGSRSFDSMGVLWTVSADGAAVPAGRFVGGHDFDDRDRIQSTGMTAVTIDRAGDLLTGGGRGEILRWGTIDGDEPGQWEIEPFGQLTLTNGSRPQEGPVTSIDSTVDGAVCSSGENGWVVIWPAR